MNEVTKDKTHRSVSVGMLTIANPPDPYLFTLALG
jgi:hypothetical protein